MTERARPSLARAAPRIKVKAVTCPTCHTRQGVGVGGIHPHTYQGGECPGAAGRH